MNSRRPPSNNARWFPVAAAAGLLAAVVGVGIVSGVLFVVTVIFVAGFFAVWIFANAFLDAVLIFTALIVCVKFLDMGFGALGPALLKIFAIAIGPTALGHILAEMLDEPLGTMGAIIAASCVAIVLYYTLIKVFFDLDLGETLLLTGIIYMVQRWVKMFLLQAEFQMKK